LRESVKAGLPLMRKYSQEIMAAEHADSAPQT